MKNKLTLNQETLRNLTTEELRKVAGGVSGTCPRLSICNCTTRVTTCFMDPEGDGE